MSVFSQAEKNANRVLVIGLDGATWDLITPWAEQGKLPFFARLMAEGTRGILNSTIPPVSPAAWTSFSTGKNPGKHGIFDFTRRDFASYRMRLNTKAVEPSLWRLLSDGGKRVVVVNVPQTYPPEPVNGILISGMGTPSHQTFTHPAELTDELRGRGYEPNPHVAYQAGNEAALLAQLLHDADQTGELSLALLQKQEWDFFMTMFRITDEATHFFWKFMDETHPLYADTPYRDAVLRCYQKAEAWVQRLVDAAGAGVTVFLISDHGAGALYQDVYLNEWLRQDGFLKLRDRAGTDTVMTRLLQRVGLTRTRISHILRQWGWGEVLAWLRGKLGERLWLIPDDARPHLSETVDWANTRAYSVGYIGQIYVNLAGRDPQGIVQSGAEYERVRAEIMARLKAWRDPDDGAPIVDHVWKKEEVYTGRHLAAAPDLLLIMRGLAYVTRQSYELAPPGVLFAPSANGESGGHRVGGIFLGWGAGVQAGLTLDEREIVDIAPTILYLLDAQIPTDMDGAAITDMFMVGSAARYVSAAESDGAGAEVELTAEEEEELLERLRGLGYID